MKENLRLMKELDEAKKGKSLSKKTAAFFAKENQLEAYRFINQYNNEFD
jgi:hypothetical protein